MEAEVDFVACPPGFDAARLPDEQMIGFFQVGERFR
jgi:hypothetical protein